MLAKKPDQPVCNRTLGKRSLWSVWSKRQESLSNISKAWVCFPCWAPNLTLSNLTLPSLTHHWYQVAQRYREQHLQRDNRDLFWQRQDSKPCVCFCQVGEYLCEMGGGCHICSYTRYRRFLLTNNLDVGKPILPYHLNSMCHVRNCSKIIVVVIIF